MSKRNQTTGVPKAGDLKPAPKSDANESKSLRGRLQPRLLNEYKTRHEREAVIQRYVLIAVVAVAAIAIVILGISFVVDQIITPSQSVAVVNGETITVAEFESRVRLERAIMNESLNTQAAMMFAMGATADQVSQQIGQSAEWNELQVSDQLGNRVLNDMIAETLLRQEAARLGISATADDIQTAIQDYFGYDPAAAASEPTATPVPSLTPTPFVSPTPTITPTPSPTSEFTPTATLTPQPSSTPAATLSATEQAARYNEVRSDAFGTIMRAAGIGESELNAYFEVLALRDKLADHLGVSTETTTYVDARHILVATEQEALDVIAALNAGDSFAELARAVSTDTGSGEQGGELGWAAASNYVTEFADAVRTGEIGAILGPVQTQFGYHVIQVRAREERPATESQIQGSRDLAVDTYLETLRDEQDANIQLFDTWIDNVPDEPIFALTG